MLCLLTMLTGCASIVGTKTQVMGINSTPSQAKVMIKDEMGKEIYAGTTPTSVTLEKGAGYFRGHDYTVTIAKDGYSDRVVTITSKPGGWYILGNLGFGGLIGWLIVDPATGAMWNLSPEAVTETLPAQQASADGNLHVALLDDLPQAARDYMMPVN
jgi:hypothetical protein